MTDDQEVASLAFMPNVNALLRDQGVTFSRNSVVFPVCCPSRATYLSGQTSLNNNVRDNTPPEGGYMNLDASRTFPASGEEFSVVSTVSGVLRRKVAT